MRRHNLWALLFSMAVFVAGGSAIASACECMGIDEEYVPCEGCAHQYYVLQFCGGDGCIYGEQCYISGNGECCQSKYLTWNIDTDDCDPFYTCDGCGLERNHASSHKRRQARVREANEGFLTELVLTPNRCKGTYSMVYPKVPANKSAKPDKDSVQGKGGS